MKFLYPQVLWALTALLIPLVIHLFNFKRYKTLYFSSLKFIQKVDQEAKSTKQLKRILILISRILAFTALIFAFAQPYWESSKSKSIPNQPTVIYIDNSFSMQAQGFEGELLSMAKEKARQIVNSLPNDQLFIIATNQLSGREERLLTKAGAYEKIDQIDFSGITKSIAQFGIWLERTISKNENAVDWKKLNCFFLSDFQSINSGQLTYNDKISYTPVLFKAENTDNLYIDSLWFNEPINRIGKTNTLNVRVVNETPDDLSNVEMEFKGDSENKVVFVDLPAHSKTISSITVSNKQSGVHAGNVKIADKNIFFDDEFHYSYTTEKQVNVLILNGEDSSPNVPVIYSLDKYYDAIEKDIFSFTRDDLNQIDLIVLNGVNALPSGIADLLSESIKGGASVALFPGRSPVLNEWNKFLERHNMSLMHSPISGGTRIDKLNYDDSFFNGVFDKRTKELNLPGISKCFASGNGSGSSNTLITLKNGLPLLMKSSGNSNLYVFYSSLHSDFGSFITDALCSTIFLRIGELSKRQHPLFVEMGKNSVFPIYEPVPDDMVIKLKGENLELIPNQQRINGVTFLQLNNLSGLEELLAGNYEIHSDKNLGQISMNYARIESDLTPLSHIEIQDIFGGTNEDITLFEVSSTQQFDPLQLKKGTGSWRYFIILSIIFVVAEMLLIRFLK